MPKKPQPDLAAAANGTPLAPDYSETGSAGDMDAVLPISAQELLPIVGLGGSAGSIGPLREFFSRMPANSGMGFVVILHLSPEHESTLAAILSNVTPMKVVQVTQRVKIERDCVYVIPPGKQLSMFEGHLGVEDLQLDRGKRVVVDLLLRTLADTHGPRAMAIILSGADGDGAIGIKRIKERGGLTIAQEPREAEYDGMPRSAITTGMVDWVLPVAEMPARLLEYRGNEERLRLPGEELPPGPAAAQGFDEAALRETLAFLRMRTGRDFAYYKRGTILRRIGRRMQVTGLENLSDYLAFLRTHAGEAGALLQDLLISVTNFFRDREAFHELEAQLPRIFQGKGSTDQVRVWVAGCATGEEAYSLAMLLCEYASGLEQPPELQVFATDINEDAVRSAREGFYPATIAADVSPERLRRFFHQESHGYRVKRSVRESVLFAPHDLLKDPPFSRLDLITSRNLLIYLNRDAQMRAFEIFHFALRPDGMLFLGASESAENSGLLFMPLHKKHRIYSRRASGRQAPPLFTAPVSAIASWQLVIPSRAPADRDGAQVPALFEERANPSYGELHYRLLERLASPSVLVDAAQNVVHLSEHAGRYVQFAGGEPSINLLRTVHPMLRLELRAALFRVEQTGRDVEVRGIVVELEGVRRLVDLGVHPPAPNLQLVIFGEREAIAAPAGILTGEAAAHGVAPRLEEEIDHLQLRQREMVEQYEVAVEELKGSNEELQAMNEELRSATEELETGREELQSINEELVTVNQELKGKVEELDLANSDLQNLMASTHIATVFLDRELRIKRYTPMAVALFNLIPTDVGRPLSDLSHQFRYPSIASDARDVLDRLVRVEREIATTSDRWFLAQMVPYRTMDDRIAGLVLTFFDITTRKQAEEELRALQQTMAAELAVMTRLHDIGARLLGSSEMRPLLEEVLEVAVESQAADFGFIQLYDSVTGRLKLVAGHQVSDEVAAYFDDLSDQQVAHGATVRRQRVVLTDLDAAGAGAPHLRAPGQKAGYRASQSTPLYDRAGAFLGTISTFFRQPHDFSERELRLIDLQAQHATEIIGFKLAEEKLRASEERYRLIFESSRDFAILTTDLAGVITSWNPGAAAGFGYVAAEMIGQPLTRLFMPEDVAAGVPAEELALALREGAADCDRWHPRRDGSRFWVSGVLMAMAENHRPTGFLKIMRDTSAEHQALEDRLLLEQERARLFAAEQHARQEAEAANEAKDRFLAMLSHELRTPLAPIQMTLYTLEREKRLSLLGQESLAIIRRSVEMEVRLIDDLLDVSRIVHGKLHVKLAPMDLHACVLQAIGFCREEVDAAGLKLLTALDAPLAEVIGDAARLQQVFWNLLRNAAKFTPQAGQITVRSRQTRRPGGATGILVEVADTGIGIDPGALPKLFTAFAQGEPDAVRRYGGLGLGLAIANGIMQTHGGEVAAASLGRGKGAVFSIEMTTTAPIRVSGKAGGGKKRE